jgi:hypothetical protein
MTDGCEKITVGIHCNEIMLVNDALFKLSHSETWRQQTRRINVLVCCDYIEESQLLIRIGSNNFGNTKWLPQDRRIKTQKGNLLALSLAREIRWLLFIERLAVLANKRLFTFYLSKRRSKIEYLSRRFELDVARELNVHDDLLAELSAYLWVLPNHMVSSSQRERLNVLRRQSMFKNTP